MTASKIREFFALRSASAIARQDVALARLENDRPGHGAAELARRVVAATPDASKAAARRAADTVLAKRLERPEHISVRPGGDGQWRGRGLWVQPIPSRALGRSVSIRALADRLATYRKEKVRRAFLDADFRLGPDLRVAVAFGAPSVSVRHEREWVSGRRGFGWVTTGGVATVAVPERWAARVQDRMLDRTSEMLTLDAEQIAVATGDVEVYAATWVRQGRGYSLETERGCLAIHRPSGTVFHSTGNDPAKAARGLARKLTAQGVSPAERAERRDRQRAARATRQAASLARLVERVARWDLAEIEHVEVTRRDSIRAGNCEPGTDSFIERHFPGRDLDRDSATVGEIARAVGRIDLTNLGPKELELARQVAAACLHAIHRDKQARRSVLA